MVGSPATNCALARQPGNLSSRLIPFRLVGSFGGSSVQPESHFRTPASGPSRVSRSEFRVTHIVIPGARTRNRTAGSNCPSFSTNRTCERGVTGATPLVDPAPAEEAWSPGGTIIAPTARISGAKVKDGYRNTTFAS